MTAGLRSRLVWSTVEFFLGVALLGVGSVQAIGIIATGVQPPTLRFLVLPGAAIALHGAAKLRDPWWEKQRPEGRQAESDGPLDGMTRRAFQGRAPSAKEIDRLLR